MKIHETPETLAKELSNQDGVSAVSYEYPGFWHITTEHGEIVLGDVNTEIGWNGMHTTTLDGWTTETEPAKIANAFGKWLAELEEPSDFEITANACGNAGFYKWDFVELGGGLEGVKIPLKGSHFALITPNEGIGIYDEKTWIEDPSPIAHQWFMYDENHEKKNTMKDDAEKALKWLIATATEKGWM